MPNKTKYAVIYLCVVGLLVAMALNLAQANEDPNNTFLSDAEDDNEYVFDQGELNQILAPIALYPDTVLSQVLVAATYPLELVQAARWRQDNLSLSESEALTLVEQQPWDPSVKALVPFTELIDQLTDDLDWLQRLGDAFLVNETQVLTSIQNLRQQAYDNGSLEDSEYITVNEEDDAIVIAPVDEKVVYVPYYDTRVVYGNWGWHHYPPIYWSRPAHYYWHAGLYWSPRVYVRHSIFWGGFHWRKRHLVVHNYPRRHRFYDGVKRVRVNEYQRWSHNTQHRRGVRYATHTPKRHYRHNNEGVRQVNRTVKSHQYHRPSQVRTQSVDKHNAAQRSQARIQRQLSHRNEHQRGSLSQQRKVQPNRQLREDKVQRQTQRAQQQSQQRRTAHAPRTTGKNQGHSTQRPRQVTPQRSHRTTQQSQRPRSRSVGQPKARSQRQSSPRRSSSQHKQH